MPDKQRTRRGQFGRRKGVGDKPLVTGRNTLRLSPAGYGPEPRLRGRGGRLRAVIPVIPAPYIYDILFYKYHE